MTRERLIKLLGSLALVGPMAVAARADDMVAPKRVQIYSTESVVKQAVTSQTPEQSVPKSTESKDAAAATNGCGNGCGGKEEESKTFLMEQLECTALGPWLDCNGIKVQGWLSQGFTWNPDRPRNRFNFPMTFNDRSNEYQMNQFYLYAERAVNTEGCCWDFGWRADLLYGSDYYFTESTGWETHQTGTQHWNNGGPRFQFGSAALYGLAIPQLYAQIYAPYGNGWDIKLGHFYTPVGYETVTATGNFFYSHAFTHQYFEPFTHWGVQGVTPINDSLKLTLGITMGWDTLDDVSDKACYHAALSWTSCDKNTSFFYAIMAGEEAGLLAENGRVYQSIYMTHKVCENTTYVIGTDLLWQNDGSFSNSGAVDDAEAYSIYQYLLYDINKCWSAGMRFEVSRDDDNLRVIPIGAGPGALGLAGPLAEGSTFTSLTMGLNYKPFENVRIRPELRWDWTSFTLGSLSAFDDASDNNQFTASLDVIVTF